MKASILVTNVVNFWLRLITKRNRTSRFFSSANLAFFPLTSLEDETSMFGGLYCSDNNSPTNGDCISAEFGKQGNKSAVSFHEFTNQYISVFNYQKADDVEMARVRYILTKHGWNFTNYDGYGVNLDEDNVINALNNLFKETANDTLVLCFFKWLEYSVGLKHTIRSFCTMICILASGNMNYRVMDLLKNLVQDHHGEDGWHDLLLSSLQEICKGGSVLVTLYSMLVQCYVETNMANVAVKLVYQMEHSGVFPKAWVCNSLLRALLDSNQEEVAWDLLETMHSRGMINSSFISLFIYYYCSKGNIECGWKLLTDMRNYEIKPDVVSYGIVIHFLCKVCFLKEANSLLFKMIQMGLSLIQFC
ncbi:hypothetical protein Nepgr_015116 [Nepenthes gracilis]|uniref:Pentatricopeptide repeat-containing protein n=1 Tax=Nepenthes gracilis TaxID=150966 RepID=A0AAD3XR54_NEPGR|nr:hypothetical protein Nepgr_015116 [Nepenthes gracilis]